MKKTRLLAIKSLILFKDAVLSIIFNSIDDVKKDFDRQLESY
ncbi:MAG: hypothetical protein RR292_06070 [Christensenellaceae bacterium]